jgi:hypothetical protein
VAFGVTDSLVGLQIASEVSGGLVGSRVAMRGCGWPLRVTVNLGGSRMIQITCKIFELILGPISSRF